MDDVEPTAVKLTVADAAAMLGVDEGVIDRWIRDEKLPVHRVNDQHRFHGSELLEWATVRGIRVSSEKFRGPAATRAPVTLVGALTEGSVHHDVGGSDRASVLRAIVDRMPIDEDEAGLLYDYLLAREELGSTGIGDGIAIPHVRNPIILGVERPTMMVSFLENCVDFHAIDGRPVTTVFTLVTTSIRTHLYLLSRVSAALHEPTFRDAVLRRASREEVLAAALEAEGALSQLPRDPSEARRK